MKRENVQRLIDWSGRVGMIVVVLLLGLCGIGFFDIHNNGGRTKRTKALAHAKQVYLALMDYAFDYDGKFPSSRIHSNAAYRQLFDRKFQDERIFFVPGCAWHKAMPDGKTKPDNDAGDPPDYVQGLAVGENHWSYQSGLTNEAEGNLPIVMDAFSGRVGIYAEDPDERGGVWHGEVAIVVRIDGSAKMEKLAADLRVYENGDGKKVDIFSKEYGTDPAKLLNPW